METNRFYKHIKTEIWDINTMFILFSKLKKKLIEQI